MDYDDMWEPSDFLQPEFAPGRIKSNPNWNSPQSLSDIFIEGEQKAPLFRFPFLIILRHYWSRCCFGAVRYSTGDSYYPISPASQPV
jgi:hypothetical protein